jgi:hypothetical protein
MTHGDVVDEFHDKHSLSDTGTAEETNLTSLGIGGEEINNFNAGLENLFSAAELGEGRRLTMDGVALLALDGSTFIDGLTSDTHDTTKSGFADRNHNGTTHIVYLLTTLKTFGGIHGNATDNSVTKMLGYFKDELGFSLRDPETVENSWHLILRENDVNDGTNNLCNHTSVKDGGSVCFFSSGIQCSLCLSGKITSTNILESGTNGRCAADWTNKITSTERGRKGSLGKRSTSTNRI